MCTSFVVAQCAHANRETNIIGMRLGPGKYLKGRTLLGGVITPEEFDHFHEVCCSRLRAPNRSLVD